MKYNFKDILNADIYENTSVMFVLGKYTIFNNMVADTLKQICIDTDNFDTSNVISMDNEFGLDNSQSSEFANNVDFNTFLDVVGVSSLYGKWFCRTDLSLLNKKQRTQLTNYIKVPSNNGILVITSENWQDYREFLKNRTLAISKVSHIIQLSFPNKPILKNIVKQMFEQRGLEVDNSGVDLFIMRISSDYNSYDSIMDNIAEEHKEGIIDSKLMKEYLKGIENFVVEDYIEELMKPLSSGLTNNKKVLRMMIMLEDELGPKNLIYQLLKIIDESIEYRILINNGYIPIGINYFFNEVIDKLPNKEKYKDIQEWQFRKKALLASQTSIKDWQFMRMTLLKAIENPRMSEDMLNRKCEKALYEISTRSVLTDSRVENIMGFDDIISNSISSIDRNIILEHKE